METAELLFEILRSEVNGKPVDTELFRGYDPDQLYKIAQKHDLTYCAADALTKAGLLPKEVPAYDSFMKKQASIIIRTVRIEEAIERIKETLNGAKIPFVPLKGARIRAMYPDKMMRSSCDIDILVREEDLDRAVSTLVDHDFTTDGKREYHDISLYSGKIHLELHFNICENMEDIDVLLKRVWEFAEPVSEFEYHEKPEFFVYHHLAHMKYHFVRGGCGIRPFLDLFVMRKAGFYEEEKLAELLETVGLNAFYQAVLQVIGVWFEGAPQTELTQKCEEYILRGGVYGSMENSVAAQSAVQNGRIKNVWSILFPGYESMCNYYPVLKEKKILLPFYYMKRIVSKVFGKSSKRVRNRMRTVVLQDQKRIDSVEDLLIKMGIR